MVVPHPGDGTNVARLAGGYQLGPVANGIVGQRRGHPPRGPLVRNERLGSAV